MSEWIVENVRFTLYNGERKERVIVQKNNGDLTVTSKQREDDAADDKHDAKAKPDTRDKAKPDTHDKVDAEAKSSGAERKSTRGKKAPPETPPPAPAADPPKNGTSLEWAPIVDAGYDGFAAKSHGAEIHVLKTTSGGWAIYVFWGRGVMKHIACHAKLEDAKTAAQALHDEGLPPRPEPRLTQEMIDNACPAPAQQEPARPPRKPRAKQAGPETDAAAQEEAPARPARKPRAKKADDATGETATKETKPTEGPTELTPELRTELRDSFKDVVVEVFKQAE